MSTAMKQFTEISLALHYFVSLFVRSFKFLEFQIMKLFPKSLESIIISSYGKHGVNFHGKGVSFSSSGKNSRPKNKWDIQVHHPEFFIRVANNCLLGLGESYMKGLWDCEDIPEMMRRALRGRSYMDYYGWPLNRFLNYINLSFFNLQVKSKAFEVGEKHYDLGNDLYESFLDKRMIYTCAYYGRGAKNLDEAQLHKLQLIGDKLQLKEGMRVLDLGCGWGGLCKFLAETYKVSCIGVTVSKEGVRYGNELCQGLDVEIRLQDYRDVEGKFDRITAIGILEHVGTNNYKAFFEHCNRLLTDDGILLLHCIGYNEPTLPPTEPFFNTYIFPNGNIPYAVDVMNSMEGKFIVEDWHNFGHDYSKTLLEWEGRFEKAWPSLEMKYGKRFYRMWRYYLLSCSGAFQSRKFQLWQMVLTKDGMEGGYRCPR